MKTILMTILLCSLLNADTLDTYIAVEDNAQKQAKEMNLEDKVKEMPTGSNFNEKIQDLYKDMQPKINEAKETMFNGLYKKSKLQVNKDRTTPQTTHNINIEELDLSHFLKKNRIYIFMSSSVPKKIWYEYGSYMFHNKIINASMYLRGCIGGCERIKPTMMFIKSILEYDKNEVINPNIGLDPLLFRKYNISNAPCFVYAKDVNILDERHSEGLDSNVQVGDTYKSCGSWGFKWHIEELYKQSKDEDLKKLLNRL